MPKKGYKQTQAHKDSCAKLRLGNQYRLGIPHTKTTKDMLSQFMKAHPNSGQFKKGQVSFNKDKKMTDETRRKMSESKIGRVSTFKGKKHSKESKLKNRLSHLDKPNFKLRGKGNGMYGRTGEKCPRWNGGLDNYKYPKEFSPTLKEDIRRRDKYKCQLCNLSQEENLKRLGIKLPIHHIDYNKQNCSHSNLITLCQKCNIKVNDNRDYWFAYFTYILSI